MALRWTTSANRDLVRLYDFLEPADPDAAARAVGIVLAGVKHVARHPRLGRRLHQFDPREVRRAIIGDHELRYEVRDSELIVLRVFHVHEDR